MTGSIMLRPASGFSAWQFDAVNNEYFLQIGGVTKAKIDSNGNLKITGKVLKIS